MLYWGIIFLLIDWLKLKINNINVGKNISYLLFLFVLERIENGMFKRKVREGLLLNLGCRVFWKDNEWSMMGCECGSIKLLFVLSVYFIVVLYSMFMFFIWYYTDIVYIYN